MSLKKYWKKKFEQIVVNDIYEYKKNVFLELHITWKIPFYFNKILKFLKFK